MPRKATAPPSFVKEQRRDWWTPADIRLLATELESVAAQLEEIAAAMDELNAEYGIPSVDIDGSTQPARGYEEIDNFVISAQASVKRLGSKHRFK